MFLLAAIAIAAPASGDAAETLEAAGRYREAEPLLRRAVDRPAGAIAMRWPMRANGLRKIWRDRHARWRLNPIIAAPLRSA